MAFRVTQDIILIISRGKHYLNQKKLLLNRCLLNSSFKNILITLDFKNELHDCRTDIS